VGRIIEARNVISKFHRFDAGRKRSIIVE